MPDTMTLARPDQRQDDPTAFHVALARWNRRRLAVQTPSEDWRDREARDARMRIVEGEFIERARRDIAARAEKAPRNAEQFAVWFEALKATGPGQGDPLFPWLAEEASLDEMSWFLTQEIAGEAGFDDLVALSQIKLIAPAKLELARNYWDEMGRGNPKGMHGPMLDDLASALGIKATIEGTLWQSLALANAMVAMAMNRRYVYLSIGALGVIELTAPGRAALVAKGLKRLGVGGRARHYFDLHAVLDVKHSEAWNREALIPLVDADPNAARYIAEGALIRLSCGARCFDAYRAHLWSKRA